MIDLAWYLRNLLSYSLQLGLLIGAAALVHTLFPVRLPRLSYAYWRILLLACLLLPLIEPWPAPARGATSPPVAETQVLPGTQLPAGPAPEAEWQFPYLPVLAGLLGAGVLFRLARVLVGAMSLQRSLKRARPVTLPWGISQLAPGIGRQPRVCCIDGVHGPATYGFLRPVILLPADFSDLTETQQLGVICHELRHVQRRDWLYRLAEEITRSLFWFHPLVLWLTNRIELSREQCVDQEVVRMLGRSHDYLDSLMEMARARMSGPVAALFVSESHLGQRVRLIKEGFTMSVRRLALSLGVSFVILVTAASLAVWAFPLQGREQDQPRPAGVPGGSSVDTQKRGPEADRQEATSSQEPVKIGGNVATSKVIHWVPPEYPVLAESARIKGMVLMRVTISEAGDVTAVEVVRGHPLLVSAAIAAVRQWKYSPTLLDGRAVPVIATQTVSFPPGTGPEFTSRPPEPETTVRLFLDEAGSFWGAGKCLEGNDLINALKGKQVVELSVSPVTEPSNEVLNKAIKTLQSAGSGIRVNVASLVPRNPDSSLIPVASAVVPQKALTDAGKLLGYAYYQWFLKEDGQRLVGQKGWIPNASRKAYMAGEYNSDSWTVTATYQLTRDSEARITGVSQTTGSSLPEIEEIVRLLTGKTYQGSSPTANLEFEISFR